MNIEQRLWVLVLIVYAYVVFISRASEPYKPVILDSKIKNATIINKKLIA